MWSGDEPRCELTATEAQESSGLGTGIAIGATVIIALLFMIGLIFIHRNKARPVKNTENVQAAETKDERSAAVMSYSTLEANTRMNMDNGPPATFNTFHGSGRGLANGNGSLGRGKHIDGLFFFKKIFKIVLNVFLENIYDQIPNEQFYDAPYEMRNNDEVYEPEPSAGNVITINGISVR